MPHDHQHNLLAGERALAAVRPSLRLPGHVVHLVWHQRPSHDAGPTWLRGMIAEAARRTAAA
ncbi:hypothetical protein WME94_52190 [Sorangium sp. So ce429]